MLLHYSLKTVTLFGRLKNSTSCLYIAPPRSLAGRSDLHKQ